MNACAKPRVLVADIGGTNARFALAVLGDGGRPQLMAVHEFSVADFASPAQAALRYLSEVDQPLPEHAVISVASAITGDEIKLTNSGWSFSVKAFAREIGGAQVRVINDLAAVGRAIPHLTPDELTPIGRVLVPPGDTDGDRHFAVVGPGTGLGVGRVLLRGANAVVLETEGGHIGFAPQDAYEIAILQFMMQRFPRVSVERLLCGPGLKNLYQAVCAVEGTAAVATSPEAITAGAEAGDAPCQRTRELFCAMLGSFAGDVALIHGAWHGVYLSGGMTARLLPLFDHGAFRRRFEAKGRFRPLMQAIPTLAIANPRAGLLGAAVAAQAIER